MSVENDLIILIKRASGRSEKGLENDLRYFYNQAHLPVRQQDEAVGHAVRAVYLYSV